MAKDPVKTKKAKGSKLLKQLLRLAELVVPVLLSILSRGKRSFSKGPSKGKKGN
jgi:hypothetical protein|tara:strand:+ start:3311 stop:3472 length:162 start_codon:yes stop_codon:yes gene_type:complete